MRPTVAEKRAVFRRLHQDGCFVIPNPWDVGSAVMLQSLGFKALASTSAGMAWTLGRPDNGVRREDVLVHLAALVEAVDVPVNADYENAFADDPEGVAASVGLAAGTGIAGLSVEDSTGDRDAPLYDFTLAVERVAAARAALDADAAVPATATAAAAAAARTAAALVTALSSPSPPPSPPPDPRMPLTAALACMTTWCFLTPHPGVGRAFWHV